MLVYDTVETIWRPLARGQFLVYKRADVLRFLDISRAQLTALGVVSRNDYASNLTRLGVATNFKIVKSLGKTEADVEKLVERYLAHPNVVSKNPSATHFEAAIRVFVHRMGNAPSATQPEPSQPVSQGVTTQEGAQQSADLKGILDRLQAVRLQLKENNKSSTVPAQSEEPFVVFNRYNTVDRPPEQRPRPHESGSNYKYRQRYAIKTRTHLKKHDAPESMKQYQLKPWKLQPDSPLDPSSNKNGSRPLPKVRDVTNMDKKNLVEAMAWDHPTRTLDLGTINSNATRVLNRSPEQLGSPALVPLIKSSLSRVVRLSLQVKRTCQSAIGQYIEHLALHYIGEEEEDEGDDTNKDNEKEDNMKKESDKEDDESEGGAKKDLDSDDRALLNLLCPGFSNKDLANFSKDEMEQEPTAQESMEEVDDSGDKKNLQFQFLISLLIAIHTAKRPTLKGKEVAGKTTGVPGMPANVCSFIDRAKGFLPEMTKDGTAIEVLKNKGLLPRNARDFIDPKKSAIENFVLLNRVCGSRRCLVPMSSFEDKFVTLSELDLSRIFWQDPFLKARIQSFVVDGFEAIHYADQVTLPDVVDWLSGAKPGEFITQLLTDIGGYSAEERRKLRNFSRSTFMMPLEEMRAHLQRIRAESFQPAAYAGRGYVLRGSIRTDGFRLQAIAFKLNELHCVKYRRLRPDKLPSGTSRLTSTLGGTDYFLTEIRNVVTTQQDVADLWGCNPHRIKVLGIDLGQAFVVGASAILPPPGQPSIDDGQDSSDSIMELPPSDEDIEGNRASETEKPPPKYFNLACKQKAVYQPTFKHRRWLERRKEQGRVGEESISHIETSLPYRHGPEASIRDYTARVKEVEDDLDSFYGSVVLKKHKWNARKARTEEYRLIANRLLQLVGGSLGAKREAENKVVIGVGLGQFSCKTRLSSLHESFQSYFVQKARSLGYIVVGVNEYYTSKKCPACTEFVGQVDIRRLYCTKCQKYMHRDVMAGHNIANAVQGHLLEQQRPLYLQPVDTDGQYPWMQDKRGSKPRPGGSGS
ncbi:hypothetical protein BGX33_000520, partial [Mortierella sp. NVP41]